MRSLPRHFMIKPLKDNDKKISKTAKEKLLSQYKRASIRLIAYFLSEIMKARNQHDDILLERKILLTMNSIRKKNPSNMENLKQSQINKNGDDLSLADQPHKDIKKQFFEIKWKDTRE